MILHIKLHLFRLYDGVPEGLHLRRFCRFDGRVIPEKSSLGDTVEAPVKGPMFQAWGLYSIITHLIAMLSSDLLV